jgi:hypothetical protein
MEDDDHFQDGLDQVNHFEEGNGGPENVTGVAQLSRETHNEEHNIPFNNIPKMMSDVWNIF